MLSKQLSVHLQFLKNFNWNESKTHFFYPKGVLYHGDCLALLKQIPSKSIDVIFADPPYNIRKTKWDQFHSDIEYWNWCKSWIKECSRIIKLGGSTFIMGFSEILSKILSFSCKSFPEIHWLVWHYRNKPTLGKKDWVRSHESILHLRTSLDFNFNSDAIREPYNQHTTKYPDRAQGKSSQFQGNKKEVQWWTPDLRGAKPRDVIDIPALNNSMKEKTSHPTQKPEALLRKLLMGTINKNGIVLDPFCGSGTTSVVAEQMKLPWISCELEEDYITIITKRIHQYREHFKPLEEYLKIDLKQAQNRLKVRG